MENQVTKVDWDNILKSFSSHKGTIRSFCRENNISIHQLYYRRKKEREKNYNKPEFQSVTLNKDNIIEKPIESTSKSEPMIKIEIGKANIFIPSEDKVSISSVLKEILSVC